MKITILGRGNAGCISAMHFAYFRKFINSKILMTNKFNNYQVTVYLK